MPSPVEERSKRSARKHAWWLLSGRAQAYAKPELEGEERLQTPRMRWCHTGEGCHASSVEERSKRPVEERLKAALAAIRVHSCVRLRKQSQSMRERNACRHHARGGVAQ